MKIIFLFYFIVFFQTAASCLTTKIPNDFQLYTHIAKPKKRNEQQ